MPRGRQRKPRLTRMDAAVDAMSQLGFQDRLVKKCVKQLLKEYGGDDAWPFIEEYAYRELIEAILRDNDENGQVRVREEGETSQDHACLSSIRPEPENTSQENETPLETSNGKSEKSREVAVDNSFNSGAEPGCSKLFSSSSRIIAAEGDTPGCKDIVRDQTSVSTEQTDDVVCNSKKQPKTPEAADKIKQNIGEDPNYIEAAHQDNLRQISSICPEPENTLDGKGTPSETSDREPENTQEVAFDNSSNSAAESDYSKLFSCSSVVITSEGDTTGWKDVVQERTSVSTEQTDDAGRINGKRPKTPEPAVKVVHKSGDDPNQTEAFHQVNSPIIQTDASLHPLIVNKQRTKRHFPCHGWIDDDDDDEDSPRDLVYSKPVVESDTSSSLPIVDKQTNKRHFPCYGWIENDEGCRNDFVYSKPAFGSFGPKADDRGKDVLRSPLGGRKRKQSRWDLYPYY